MESYPRPRSPEFSSDSDKEKSESDSKKEKKIGGKVAETIIKPPAETRGDSLEPKNAESIWQRIAALAEKREIDKNILKPVENADTDSKLGAKKTAETGEKSEAAVPEAEVIADAATETEGADKEAPEVLLESLSPDETRETLRRYAQSRKQALAEELQELPEGEPVPAESAADLAFIHFVEQQLAENPDQPVEAALDQAEETTAGLITEEETPAEPEGAAETAAAEDTHEDAGETPAERVEPTEGEIPLDSTDEEAPIVINQNGNTASPSPTSGSGGNSGNNGNGGNGNLPPTPPGANQPPTPGSGGSGSGNVPPGNPPRSRMPGPGMPVPGIPPQYSYAQAYPASMPRFNAAPGITDAELWSERRRAMVQGFLVGGILGYLIGRRRGRIKAEKRLLPIQKKLEKQVKNLAETVAFKETAIRKQAAETAAKMKTLEEQKLFAERLAAAADANAMNEAAQAKHEDRSAERIDAVKSTEQSPAERTEARHAAALHHELQHTAVLPPAERLGRMVVEAPAAAVVAAGVIHAEENRGVSAEPIDFHKKVEDYTPKELNQAAEKIRVDGVTLREIRNEHKLDDSAVRRIITKFVEGGSVREAITRELFEHDLRYERDPKHRRFEADNVAGSGGTSGSDGGAISAAAATAIGLAADAGGRAAGSEKSGDSQANLRHKPTPDQKTLHTVRNRQIAEVSVGITVLLAIVVAIVVLLS